MPNNQREALTPLTSLGPRIDRSTVTTATSVPPPPRPNPRATYRPLSDDDDWAQRVLVSMSVEAGETQDEDYFAFVTQRAHGRSRRVIQPTGGQSTDKGTRGGSTRP